MKSPTIPGHQPGAATHEGGPAAVGAAGRESPGQGGATCATFAQRFPAADLSVGRARRFLLEQVPGGCADSVDLMALMLSELATNAVQHADTDFEVGITVTEQPDGRWARVSVRDEATGFPTPQDPPADAPHGRGLRIVESLADAWGIEVRRDGPGKTVWFTARLGSADGGAAAVAGREDEAGSALGLAPESGVDAVVATDERGVIHYANLAAEELMGWPRIVVLAARRTPARTEGGA